MSKTTSLSYLSLLAAPAAAFWRLPCTAPIVTERADPIVSPGNVSGHVHQIMGGNGFDFEMDYADTQASTCTSCTVMGDFSNYWTPNLYYQYEDGTFEAVNQVGGGLVYYLQRPGPNNDPLLAFPEGLRMISGDPFKRSGGDDFASQAISYACLDYSDATPETGGFPTKNCPDGLRSQVFFPSCWDGVNLDSSDHKSHMAFPIENYNGGSCPSSHPVHLISIFYEITWDVDSWSDKWYNGSWPFVWSMGDPTGYGFHGDFIMGWDRDILQRAVDNCTADSGEVEDCPVFSLYPTSTAQGCRVADRVGEDVQGPMASLLGCNPVQYGPEEASVITTCAGSDNATIGAGKSFYTDLTSSGWAYQGCGYDSVYARSLTGASTSGDSMTNEQCVEFCGDKGFSIAGTEYARECYCGNSIPASAAPITGVPGDCTYTCSGDSNEYCGGYGLLSLYQKCTGSTCSNVGASNTSSSTASATSAAASSTSASNSTASNSTATPSSVSSSTSLVSRTTSANSSATSNATTSSVSSGTSLVSTTTSKTSTSSAASSGPTNVSSGLPTNWSYMSCITDTLSPRTFPVLAPYYIGSAYVTSASCVSYCSGAGYAFAGTEYSGECYCSANAPATTLEIDASKCSMTCKGDSSQLCGGSAALSFYADTSALNQTSGWVKRDEEEVKMASWIKRGDDEVKQHMKEHARGLSHGKIQA